MPYVNTCCCGCDLQTGTIAILIFTIVFLLSSEFFEEEMNVILHRIPIGNMLFHLLLLAYFICTCIGLYAAIKKIPKYMIPVLVTHVLLLGFMAIGVIILLLASGVSEKAQTLLGSLAFTFLLELYFGVVMYSFYQQLTGR